MWKLVFALFLAVLPLGSEGIPGGLIVIDINSKVYLGALNFAVVQHNADFNFIRKPLKVLKVTSQVVAGTVFTITVVMAKTSCRTGSVIEYCAFHTDPAAVQPYTCEFKVSSGLLGGFSVIEKRCVYVKSPSCSTQP